MFPNGRKVQFDAPRAGGSQPTDQDDAVPRWALLHRVGAAAAVASAVLIPIQVAVFAIRPPPLDGTAADWFALLHHNRLAGLVDLDLLLAIDNALLVPLLLALYVVLRKLHESAMTLAVALGFVSIVTYLGSNPAVQMATLSDRYAAATSDAERAATRAAGEAVLATWQGSGFHAAYLLGSVAGLVIGIVMLRSGLFSRATGWLAILANGVGLGLYLPGVGVYVAVFSVVFLEIWYLLVARRLVQIRPGALT
jgi:Domain of unknown function (DUF4386)